MAEELPVGDITKATVRLTRGWMLETTSGIPKVLVLYELDEGFAVAGSG